MSGKHNHKAFEGHMHDFEAHIRAVEEDLEYYRAKRFEPRIIYLIRRGVVTFSDLLKARVTLKRSKQFFKLKKPQARTSKRGCATWKNGSMNMSKALLWCLHELSKLWTW